MKSPSNNKFLRPHCTSPKNESLTHLSGRLKTSSKVVFCNWTVIEKLPVPLAEPLNPIVLLHLRILKIPTPTLYIILLNRAPLDYVCSSIEGAPWAFKEQSSRGDWLTEGGKMSTFLASDLLIQLHAALFLFHVVLQTF